MGREALEAMVELRRLLRIGDEGADSPDAMRIYGGEPRLSIVGNEDLEQFELSLGRLWQSDTDVHQTVGQETIASELLQILRHAIGEARDLQRQDADLLMAKLKSPPVQGFSVLRQIEGVGFKGVQPCSAGSCRIVQLPRDLPALDVPTDHTLLEKVGELDGVFVQYEVPAREPQRATELADEVFGRLEALLRVAAGIWHERAQIRILDGPSQWHREVIVIGQQGGGSESLERSPYALPIWIDEVVQGIEGHHPAKYWPLAGTKELSKLERGILRGILWLGRAYSSQRAEDAFLQCAIALEVALVANPRDVITPSILYQLAESVAVILGRDQGERLQIDKEMRKFYGKRSAIVHKGSGEVSRRDCARFLSYARNCLIFLLGDDAHRQHGSLEALHRHIKAFKFSDRQ